MHTKKERLGALYPQRTDVRNNAHGFYDFSIIVDVFAVAVCADGCSSTPARCRRHWRKRWRTQHNRNSRNNAASRPKCAVHLLHNKQTFTRQGVLQYLSSIHHRRKSFINASVCAIALAPVRWVTVRVCESARRAVMTVCRSLCLLGCQAEGTIRVVRPESSD